jgi:hypothetical protein
MYSSYAHNDCLVYFLVSCYKCMDIRLLFRMTHMYGTFHCTPIQTPEQKSIRTSEAGHFPNNEIFKTSNFFERLIKQVDCWSAIRLHVTDKTGLQDIVQYTGRYVHPIPHLQKNYAVPEKVAFPTQQNMSFSCYNKILIATGILESLHTRCYCNFSSSSSSSRVCGWLLNCIRLVRIPGL